LPGVKELLNESDDKRSAKPGESLKSVDGRDMRDVYQSCDAEYFGYDDLYNPGADSRTAADSAIAPTTPSATSAATGDFVSRDAQRQRVLALERVAEKRMRDDAVAAWRAAKRKRVLAARGVADDGTSGVGGDDNDDDNDAVLGDDADNAVVDEDDDDDDGMAALLEHYQAPTQEQIKSALDAAALAKAKAALLKKLTSNSKE
jgi:hypothetical protein